MHPIFHTCTFHKSFPPSPINNVSMVVALITPVTHQILLSARRSVNNNLPASIFQVVLYRLLSFFLLQHLWLYAFVGVARLRKTIHHAGTRAFPVSNSINIPALLERGGVIFRLPFSVCLLDGDSEQLNVILSKHFGFVEIICFRLTLDWKMWSCQIGETNRDITRQ